MYAFKLPKMWQPCRYPWPHLKLTCIPTSSRHFSYTHVPTKELDTTLHETLLSLSQRFVPELKYQVSSILSTNLFKEANLVVCLKIPDEVNSNKIIQFPYKCIPTTCHCSSHQVLLNKHENFSNYYKILGR